MTDIGLQQFVYPEDAVDCWPQSPEPRVRPIFATELALGQGGYGGIQFDSCQTVYKLVVERGSHKALRSDVLNGIKKHKEIKVKERLRAANTIG